MAPKTRPYEQFGPYLLFRKLESDALGDVWRAAKITGATELGPLVALRRFTGGDRAALLQSATDARAMVPLLNGTTFVKAQMLDVADAVPFLAFEYANGRSLRHILDRARGGNGISPSPLPIDLALLIAERVALSLSTIGDMRYGGDRLLHGALIPQFIWVTEEGEIRVAGQGLGRGIRASLADAKVHAEIGRYFPPESHGAGVPDKSGEVYALGAILFALVSGIEPPDPLSVTAFTQSIRAAKTMTGQAIPLEIRTILDKSLILDPKSRYASVAEMKQAIDAAVAKFPATTFNLAFYLSTLLKKELEAEAVDREKESKVNVAAYTAVHAPAPTFASAVEAPAKRRRPMLAAAALGLLAVAVGAAFVFMKQGSAAPEVKSPAAAAPAPQPAAVAPQPIVASTAAVMPSPEATTASAAPDPAAQKKAFEDAVNRKMQQEMLKLQASFNRELQQKKDRNAPVAPAAAPPPVQVAQVRPSPQPDEPAPSAAALDARRVNARQETTTEAAAAAQQPPVPVPQPAAAQPVVTQPAVAPAPARPVIHEGDVVDAENLDVAPRPLNTPIVRYPPMAARTRAETSVILTALVSETGDVLDVRILRGDARFGFNDAALRAVRGMKFSPPMKEGKRVRTWFAQIINFKL